MERGTWLVPKSKEEYLWQEKSQQFIRQRAKILAAIY
jgi:hypothetical protein